MTDLNADAAFATDKPFLLIVEDDVELQTQLRWHFNNYNVVVAHDVTTALAAFKEYRPSVVLQDLDQQSSGPNGIDEGLRLMQQIMEVDQNAKVIVTTDTTGYTHAIRAVGLGAYDYYQKPLNMTSIDLIIQRAFQMYDLEQQNMQLRGKDESPLAGFVTSDPAMLKVCRKIEKIAPTELTSLLQGESGTGKEVMARAIHDLSARKDKPFVAINCAAIPETLIESELFGYEKGAFTGADKRTAGKIEAAEGGTLFLDELGDMPLPVQAKMLRFLQERVVERLGGRKEIPVDIRVVCATNRDLDEMVANGTFREDLFFRVTELTVQIPALRDRGQDRMVLARHLLDKFNNEQQRNIINFSEDAIAAIESYDWPGNVRELENKVKHAVIMGDGKFVSSRDLGLENSSGLLLNLRHARESAERSAITQALCIAEGKISAAAKLLGVTRPTL